MSKVLNDATKNIFLANCLYDCIEDNNIGAVKKLLQENGANSNIIIPEKGITPFHFAIGSGCETTAEEITKLFLAFGGDPNVRSTDNLTPVHVAAAWGRLNVLNILLKWGGDPSLTDEEGKTALDYAQSENYSYVVECLKTFLSDNDLCNNFNDNNKSVFKTLNITIDSEEDNSVKKNSFGYISSEDSVRKNYSRESGIMTIPESSTAEYMTCESINTFEKNITNSLITLDLSCSNLTSDKSVQSEKKTSLVSVEEEYKYIDKEEGIVLIEKHLLVNPKTDDNQSCVSGSSRFSIDYDTDTLRHELTSRGEPPGPITTTTKRVYLRRLKKLLKCPDLEIVAGKKVNRVYSVELEKTFRNPNWSNDLSSYKALESVVVNQFSKPEPSKRWREGLTKTSFTYLLLDPRVTLNLPVTSSELAQEDVWKTFLSAIFYVGKGKRSRPYCHLYEAVNFWKNNSTANSKKINYILDIWNNNFGVVCLHIFQNVIPVEAYTREAAMIKALKLENLCNSKLGDFYGICATWPERKKRLLGVYLLYRAMLIFLNEGERQLMPDDIGR